MTLGWGDLMIMGGTCQRTWEHAVPKVSRANPRMAIMFRPEWEEPDGPPGLSRPGGDLTLGAFPAG